MVYSNYQMLEFILETIAFTFKDMVNIVFRNKII